MPCPKTTRHSGRPSLGLALALLAASGCRCQGPAPYQLPHGVASFQVQVTAVTQPDGTPLASGDGTAAAPYPFPFGDVLVTVQATALDERGQPMPDFDRPVAVRVSPGDLEPTSRWLPTTHGIARGSIQVQHVYGPTHVWALDSPPVTLYADGGEVDPGAPAVAALPDGGSPFTDAAGVSQAVYFQKPTLVDVQRQPGCDPSQSYATPVTSCSQDSDCTDPHFGTAYHCYQHLCQGACDNRLSPLSGDFVSLDVPPPQTDMLVTAITQDGFYLSDLKAQKLNDPNNPSTPAWQALPGNFASLFVYTYSAPNDLYVGDHLLSLTGSVQEFSGDTQLDFPGWVKVDALPTPDEVPAPVPINLAFCGVDPHNLGGIGVERLCGYYNSNMMLESLESTPVIVRNVIPSTQFVSCDANGNGKLPLFVSSKSTFGGWGCYTDQTDLDECSCEIACITGMPQPGPDGGPIDYSSGICSELSTFNAYGQWEVQLPNDPAGASYTRINVVTRDALPDFNPLDLARPEHQGITFDIAGMLNQVQASRPRWLIYARDASDICCHPNVDASGKVVGTCPNGVRSCDSPTGG